MKKMSHLVVYKSPYSKTRIGKDNDGGYVISNLPDTYDLFLSGGIDNDISFENHFLKLFPDTPCIAFDGTISSLPKKNKKIKFVNKNVGGSNSETVTNLKEFMESAKNVFMKMDIEGGEFSLIPSLFENNYIDKVKQLVVEIHTDSFGDKDAIFKMFENINRTHTLIHFHGNNVCDVNNFGYFDGIPLPTVFELTYIRNDFVSEKILNTESFPQSIDMRNIDYKPEFTFNMFPYCNPA